MEHLTFLWHRGNDFHKDGTAIPLLFRAATVEDVKELNGQHKTRRLWVKPGVSAPCHCSVLCLLASCQGAVGSLRVQWAAPCAAPVGQAWGEELCGLHPTQHDHIDVVQRQQKTQCLQVKALKSMGCKGSLRQDHGHR